MRPLRATLLLLIAFCAITQQVTLCAQEAPNDAAPHTADLSQGTQSLKTGDLVLFTFRQQQSSVTYSVDLSTSKAPDTRNHFAGQLSITLDGLAHKEYFSGKKLVVRVQQTKDGQTNYVTHAFNIKTGDDSYVMDLAKNSSLIELAVTDFSQSGFELQAIVLVIAWNGVQRVEVAPAAQYPNGKGRDFGVDSHRAVYELFSFDVSTPQSILLVQVDSCASTSIVKITRDEQIVSQYQQLNEFYALLTEDEQKLPENQLKLSALESAVQRNEAYIATEQAQQQRYHSFSVASDLGRYYAIVRNIFSKLNIPKIEIISVSVLQFPAPSGAPQDVPEIYLRVGQKGEVTYEWIQDGQVLALMWHNFDFRSDTSKPVARRSQAYYGQVSVQASAYDINKHQRMRNCYGVNELGAHNALYTDLATNNVQIFNRGDGDELVTLIDKFRINDLLATGEGGATFSISISVDTRQLDNAPIDVPQTVVLRYNEIKVKDDYEKEKGPMSTGLILTIVFSSLAGALLLAFISYFVWRRCCVRKQVEFTMQEGRSDSVTSSDYQRIENEKL